MPALKTLHDFFIGNDIRYRVYDMGRGIRKLGAEQFEDFETGKTPWPYPLQQQAWLAIIGWRTENREDHFIWFLKFPLDEQGLLIQATRDDFIARMLQTVGHNLHASQQGGKLEDGMQQSPYGFKPRESTMAAFHAIAAQTMAQAPSRFYAHAKDYLDGVPGYDQWAFVGIQGLADVVARLEKDGNSERLRHAIPQLPKPAMLAICGLLENAVLPTAITETLQHRMLEESTAAKPDIDLLAALIRAFAQTPAQGLRQQLVSNILGGAHARQIEILAAVAARHWEVLQQAELAQQFVEHLAVNTLGQAAFNQVMSDLLYLPGMRAPLLCQLRNPERTNALSQAVSGLFG